MTPTPAATASLPASADVDAALDRIAPYIRRTPVLSTRVDGRALTLKLEHLQTTGAFKLRGALNAMLAAGAPERVVTASGGNHGLGVATAARMLGTAALVYVPETVPEVKARRLEESGAELIRTGSHYAEAAEAARARAGTDGLRYLHAYDDPDVVAGQGTIGAEIAADAPGCDSVAVAVGGGGLAAGVRLGAGARRVVGVEPEGCQSLHAALAAGEPVTAPVDSVASSALGAARVGDVPFGVLRKHPVEAALVTDDEIVRARDRLWE